MNPNTNLQQKPRPVAKVDDSSPSPHRNTLSHTPEHLQTHSQRFKYSKTENNHKTIEGEILQLRISLYRNAPVPGCDFYAPAQFVGDRQES